MSIAPDEKESTTISMVVEKWEDEQREQISPVHRINGYPWRLQIRRKIPCKERSSTSVYLICDKSSEAQLWKCTATIKIQQPEIICHAGGKLVIGNTSQFKHPFISWNERSHRAFLCTSRFTLDEDVIVTVDITTAEDGNRWRLNPVVNFCTSDGILVIGEEKKKFHVNKKFLASQSPFFDRLFHGDFKEKNMEEIPIEDVDFDEFSNIIGMINCCDSSTLTDNNVHKMLALADRFEIKIVEDNVINYLLSPSCSLSLSQKIAIADQYNLSFLLDHLHYKCSKLELKKLSESPECEQFSIETLRILFKKLCV